MTYDLLQPFLPLRLSNGNGANPRRLLRLENSNHIPTPQKPKTQRLVIPLLPGKDNNSLVHRPIQLHLDRPTTASNHCQTSSI